MWTRRGFGLAAGAMLASPPIGIAAQDMPDADDRLMIEGRYLPLYLELQEQVAAGHEAARGSLSQYAAFLGDERTAIGIMERPPRSGVTRPDLEGAVARDAIETIVEAAARSQIVILNEAHNISGHRAFGARVMRALRPLGFDWFAAETFTPPQGVPMPSVKDYRQGVPFTRDFGWYSQDPVFAEMVREAARLGYRFRDYEHDWMQRTADQSDAAAAIAAREQAQADNLIANILTPYPEAKVLIFVGYDHVMETPHRFGTWFASRLKSMTGIDPLTIEQSANWPALDPANDAPHVAAVLERFAPTRPISVALNGQAASSRHFTGQTDLSIFHPRLPAVSGRPGWLAADPERKPVEVDLPAFEGPALIQALHAQEGPAGIPADQFLLEDSQTRAVLFLQPGRYILRLETASGIQPAWGVISV